MTDYSRLRLQAKGDPQRLDEILQMQCRERFAGKFPETLKCGGFRFPSLLAAEQATSDALASYHARAVKPSMAVLDMTMGLGIDSFALARAGAKVTAFELDEAKAETAKANAEALGLEVDVRQGDSLEWLKTTDSHYDIVFVDPARRDGSGKRVFALEDCQPDITGENLALIRRHCNTLIVKASPMFDISKIRHELHDDTADILVTELDGECKEVVAVSPGVGNISIYDADEDAEIVFTARAAELRAPYIEDTDLQGLILAEPTAAMMKAGAFGWLCDRYGAVMADRNTHLAFLAEAPNEKMPARMYGIVSVWPFSKDGIRQAIREIGDRAEVAVRNFPMKADELRKRLKIKDGGAGAADRRQRVYGATIAGKRLILLCRPTNNN